MCPSPFSDLHQGLEKYLMAKLSDRLFGCYPADMERDGRLTARLQASSRRMIFQPHLHLLLDSLFARTGFAWTAVVTPPLCAAC